MEKKNDIKIIINKLGPIENQIIKFAPFMIFTGDSNLGKSYVNYLMYYFMHSIVDNMWVFIERFQNKKAIHTNIIDIEDWLNKGAEPFLQRFLGYDTFHCDVEFQLIDKEKDNLQKYEYDITYKITDINAITLGEKDINLFDSILNNVEIFINGESISKIQIPKDLHDTRLMKKFISEALSNYILRQLFLHQLNHVYILPPSRGSLVGENYTMKSVTSSMGMYDDFLKQYDFVVSRRFGFLNQRQDNSWTNKIQELIDGELITEKDEQFYVMKNKKKVPLRAAASSIKEIAPFVYLLQSRMSRGSNICFEEPESHLHPVMQVKLVDMIGACFNQGMFFQMTTHSDYVMQRLNQLIKLNEIKKSDKERFNQLCEDNGWDKKVAIDKDKVKGYYFELDENHQVKIEELLVTSKGIKMKSFYEVVRTLSDKEDIINDELEEIE